MSKNVSNQFKNIIKNGGPFYAYAVMTLADGTEITLTSENDFTVSGSGYSEESDSGFPFGSALSKIITLNLDNTVTSEPLKDTQSENILDTQNNTIIVSRKSEKYDYYYARIVLYTEADLPDGTTERVQEGIFTVIDSVTPGDVLEITAYDDMYKADVEFSSTLTYPVSAQMLLNEVCSKCDITLGSSTFKNNSFQIQQPPEGLTGRQVIGYIAQIAGGNAVIDRNGRLVIKTYDFSGFDVEEDVSAGEVETESGIHIISEYTTDPDIGTDDVTITGVSVTIESEDIDTEDEVYVVGSEEYAVSIDNPLISGKEKEAVDLIAESVIGITARPFSGDFFPDPTVEFMDLAYVVDRKDNVYKTFVTSHDFSYLGSSTFSCGVESPERHGGSYYSTAADVYQKAKNDLKVNKSQWEQAMEQLSQQVANASGLYTTEEEQPDGSTIFYMHNKPTLEESDIVWKMTAETLTVSTDGGKSWNAGITVNGEVIARIMNTIGINFDWGVGGTLIIQDTDGNQTAYIDAETGTVRLAVESLTITGKTVQEIASEQSDETLNNFVDSVYNPAIGNLQAQIDGQIETYYYDYEPTLNNEPASEWTTEEERRNHEGDLFYWKSKGYAYRFFKDGDTWKWQMVQDTDITKALEEAADAKDTADQKRRVFVTQPYPPYDVGDLWVGDDTSEMMRCQRARSSGSYVASDWIKAVKYTDDSEFYNFVQNDYNETIKDIYNSVDQKSETWYQATDPALEWTEIESTPLQDTTGANILDTVGETIITIWEKEKSLHNGDLWKNSTTNKEYLYQNGEWVEMPIPDEVFDMIDGKAKIFVVQPTPPYDVGDVWFTGTTILVCNTKRENGSFSESDWGKKDNYTDDSALYEFIEGDYSETVENLKNQADKKAETWYQPTDPSSSWTTTALKNEHVGDIWYNTTSSVQKSYRWDGTSWQEMKTTPPDEVFDQIDGKAQIFITQPIPPYSVGDLWFNSTTSDIMTCVTSRASGSYTSSDWQKRNKYTDDSYAEEVAGNLSNFTDQVVGDLENLQTQIDGKIETYYYDYQPTLSNIPASTWTTETERQSHEGDIFYWKSKGYAYRFYKDGSTWKWQLVQDTDITKALQQAADAQDTADQKRRVFVRQPTPPYDVGDLWAQGSSGDIMRCQTARASGNYVASDWIKASKYTDDSAVDDLDNALDQEGVFNRLTNNGQTQGIYLQNNRIYINATYIQSGTLSANLIKGGILTLGGASNGNGRLEVLNSSNQVIGTINNTGVNFTGVFQNRLGQEFIEIDESVLKGGYGSTVHGRIDLSAQYSDGSYRTVIEALSGRLVLKSINGDVEIVRTDGTKGISKGYAVVSIDGNVSTRIETMYITQTGGDYYVGFKNTQNTVRFAILTTSDAKLKKNIKDTKVTALDYINQIQHKSFDLKEGDGHKDCGYIAQDLQKIYPGFVVEAPEYNNDGEKISGTLQVNTFAMFPYITKAIQELSEENRKLKEEIKEIKNMIKSIGGQ